MVVVDVGVNKNFLYNPVIQDFWEVDVKDEQYLQNVSTVPYFIHLVRRTYIPTVPF